MDTSEIIYITDETSYDAVLRSGEEELTEIEAREALVSQGVEIEYPLTRQAFLEGDAARSNFDRIFYRVEELAHLAAYIGWVHEA